MGFYQRWIVPRLIDLAMRNRSLDAYRRRTIGAASGVVLEIGVDSGQNLPLYGSAVDHLCAIDPSAELLRWARNRTADVPMPVSLVSGSAEQLPFANAVFDTIVTTWTLCSIPNPVAALIEMRRVLKPSGNLVFVEHGLSPEPRVARWQHRLTPCWKRIAGGCHLGRKMDELIRSAGLCLSDIETHYMNGPKLVTFMYQGQAIPEPAGSQADQR
jgi:ubiquinone/menaquinone biosynthesis C-methylase UbiE